ncbi:hypothetical protein [Azoarcus sp. KH32C]|uniref:hypothetical protein n=1 Tax=Azoarcus sp. KH32C TaxID=748247 RepID=UPI0012EA7DA6|nr:hypothetical protein [Azoarcus sp. KH32C]
MPASRWLAALACLIPGAVFALSLLVEHQAYFWDGTVYRCAIEAAQATGDPYRFVGDCTGYFLPHTYPYAGTRLLAGIASMLGMPALSVAYVSLYVAGAALFVHVLYRLCGSAALVLALVVAPGAGVFVSELVSGNMAIPFYGLLLWLTWSTASATRPVAALCVVTAPFKPLYSAYLILPVLLRREFLIPGLCIVLVAAWYAADLTLFPTYFAEWLNVAVRHANEVPGFGFSMLVRKTGLGLGGGPGVIFAYLLWACGVVLLTLRAIARTPSSLVRTLVAVAGTALLLPRLKEYDCLVLVPLSVAMWSSLTGSERRQWLTLVGGFGVALPAAVWWLRKGMLLIGAVPFGWRGFVDMRWLVQNQGGFLFAAMLAALFWLACRPCTADQPVVENTASAA